MHGGRIRIRIILGGREVGSFFRAGLEKKGMQRVIYILQKERFLGLKKKGYGWYLYSLGIINKIWLLMTGVKTNCVRFIEDFIGTNTNILSKKCSTYPAILQ